MGLELIRYKPDTSIYARRKKILDYYTIDLVLDIGANFGQYGGSLRDIGYRGKIISFEPLGAAFKELQETTKKDPNWEIYNLAIGDKDGEEILNISGNLLSSSLLDMLPAHISAAPGSEYIGNEAVAINKLDTLLPRLVNRTDNHNILLKIDTQGYEARILRGAANSMKYIDLISLEMSVVPLYQEEVLFHDMHGLLTASGFRLISIEPGFCDTESGRMLQLDGIYSRH